MVPKISAHLQALLEVAYGAAQTEEIIAGGYGARRPVTLRVNTVKCTPEEVCAALAAQGIACAGVPWSADALILQDVREDAIRPLPIYREGKIYLQSLSSMLPPLLLRPQPGETVLDMAAAPGGKTTQLFALSGGRAQITACEQNRIRAQRLRYNLELQGASRVLLMTCDARRLDPLFAFDEILLDAPCSGSGTVHAADTADTPGVSDAPAAQFTPARMEHFTKTQQELLAKALSLLKPGHEMIYSTCSILPQENEQVLQSVLRRARAELLPLRPVCPPGLPDALPLLPTTSPDVLCVKPDALFEGFFLARLRRL